MKLLHQIEKCLDAFFAIVPRPKPSVNQANNVRIIAHRGAHDGNQQIQENSINSFQKALDLGCFGVELDIHATKDNILVVNHDSNLERFWNCHLTIRQTNFKELKKHAPDIPTLAEVVAQFGKKMHLFIEPKAPFTSIDELAKVLSPLSAVKDYHLLSLKENLLFQLATKFPKNSLFLVPLLNNTQRFYKLGLQENYAGVLGHYFLLQKKQIKNLSANNQIAGVGFIDSKFSLYREINRGIKYIFSNNVKEVMSYLKDITHPN